VTAILEFDAVKPIGSRTSADLPLRRGGVQHTWLESDIKEYAVEVAALKRGDLEPKLSKREHLDALGIFQSMKNKAARGQLEVGTRAPADAKVMKRLSYLIELVPRLSRGRRPPRLFRLYYAEPAIVQGALLPLVLSTKPNSDDPDKEQNASIDDAKVRSRVWTLSKVMKGQGK